MNLNKLIKPFILILVIIILASVVIRISSGGETLDDYAQKNPEIAYQPASPKPQKEVRENEKESKGEKPMPAQNLNQTDNLEKDTETVTKEQSIFTESENPEMNIPIERVTYQTGFFYDPLSDDMIKRITGISYPVRESKKNELSFTPVNVVADDADLAIDYTDLRYVSVLYYNFKGIESTGELICNKAIADDLLKIFYELYQNEYQIEQIRLIDEYNGDDKLSMMDNNTSCFNYRVVDGTSTLSKHAYGLAIDLNPFFNPYIEYNKDGSLYVSPPGSEAYVDRSAPFSYKIDENDLCYRLFKEQNYVWGGDWNSMKDYQHFQKAIK